MTTTEGLSTIKSQACSAPKYITPLLGNIEAQASKADATKSIDEDVIAKIKKNDVMRLSASPEICGINERLVAIAYELRAVSGSCTSTDWCLWNHLCTFHHFFTGLIRVKRDICN